MLSTLLSFIQTYNHVELRPRLELRKIDYKSIILPIKLSKHIKQPFSSSLRVIPSLWPLRSYLGYVITIHVVALETTFTFVPTQDQKPHKHFQYQSMQEWWTRTSRSALKKVSRYVLPITSIRSKTLDGWYSVPGLNGRSRNENPVT